MIKRIKHSLENLIDRSFQNKTSKAEENLLNDFAFTEYQKSKWNDALMGNSDEASQNIYEGIQLRIGETKTFNPYLKYMVTPVFFCLLV